MKSKDQLPFEPSALDVREMAAMLFATGTVMRQSFGIVVGARALKGISAVHTSDDDIKEFAKHFDAVSAFLGEYYRACDALANSLDKKESAKHS